MANGTRTEDPEIPSWPPPRAMARMLSLVTAGGAATAGFLGSCCQGFQGAACCASLIAGVLALLSLVFNLWDFFQHRGPGAYRQSSGPTVQTGASPSGGSSGGAEKH